MNFKRIHRLFLTLTKCNWRTIDEWITGISFRTSTSWCMIYNCATCIQTTWSWTRISTFLLNACLICYAIRIDRAFWSAIRWNSDIILHASADWSFSYGFAHRVWTTRWWNTWIFRIWFFRLWHYEVNIIAIECNEYLFIKVIYK